MPYRLGVDLGTTFTAAAVANGAAPAMVGLGNRALQVPSVLFLQPDGGFLVGEPAERRGLTEPDRVVREFKRRIGDPVPILIAGSPYSPQALAATMLRWVVQSTTERMGDAPHEVILTHPANWGPYKLELLDQVVALADLPAASLLPEPLAAATQYAASAHVAPGDKLAVYDLGGGTFDVCVVEKIGAGFQVLGTPEGIEHLGGIDFDEGMIQLVLDALSGKLESLDQGDPSVIAGLARLRRDCVDAKEALSSDTEVVLPVSLPGLNTSVRLNRAEFELRIRPALMETLATMSRALRSAGVESRDLSAIVLIGGSSRIPLVGELLIREFGVQTALDTHPKHDVALGAVQPSQHASASLTPGPSAQGLVQSGEQRSQDDSGVALPTERTEPLLEPARVRPEPDARGLTKRTVRPLPAIRRGLGRHLGRPHLRRTVVLASVIVVSLSTLVAYVVVQPDPDGLPTTARTALETAAPSNGTTPASPATATQGSAAAALPRSAPLTDNQLIVPMQVKGQWRLYLGDTESSAPVRQLTSGPGNAYTPALSPDFTTMIYLVDADGSGIHRILRFAGAADGREPKDLFRTVPDFCAGNMFRPAWRPDDPTVLAVPCLDDQGRYGLYLVRTNGTLIHQVRVDQQRVDDPTFSPIGDQLAFWAGPLSGFDGGTIYTTDGDGAGAPEAVTKAAVAGQDTDPAWSPVGDEIVFRRRVSDGTTGGNAEIFSMRSNGSEPKPLTSDSADEQDPSWSRFGNRIVYKSAAPTKEWPGKAIARAWIMNADGTGKRVLWTDGATGMQGAPVWSRR
ncbi:MAG TPA: Hsp70 family protein [Microlunatus sp.]